MKVNMNDSIMRYSDACMQMTGLISLFSAPCRAAGISACCVSGCDLPLDGCSCDYSCPFSGNCCQDFQLLESCLGIVIL